MPSHKKHARLQLTCRYEGEASGDCKRGLSLVVQHLTCDIILGTHCLQKALDYTLRRLSQTGYSLVLLHYVPLVIYPLLPFFPKGLRMNPITMGPSEG